MIISSITNTFLKLKVFNQFWYSNYFKGDYLKVQKHSTFIQQRAYLSVKIIQEILSRPFLQKIQNKSLVNHLKDIICNADEKFVKSFTKTQILKLFSQPGVVLPAQIFSQERVSLGSQDLIKVSDSQNPQNLEIQPHSVKEVKATQQQQQNQGKRIIFSPTYLVTSQVFRYIIEKKPNKFAYICYGHSGISKTFSVMLYWVLSNYIMAHIFRNQKSKPAFELKYKHLKLPKLIYWSIDKSAILGKSWREIKINHYKNLHLQLPQISNVKFNLQFKQIYQQKNVRLIMVIDQIDQFASLLRQQKQKSVQFEQIRYLINIYYNLVHNLLYFSSAGIEKYLFQKLDLTFQGNLSQLIERKVYFAQFLAKQEPMYQIVDYFLFQLGRKFKKAYGTDWNTSQDKQSIKIKKQLRSNGFQILKSFQNKYFLSPLSIRQKIKEIDQKTQDIANKLLENFQKAFKKLIQDTISKEQNDFEKILNNFLIKVQEQYKDGYHLIIYELYQSAGRALINFQNKQIDQTHYQINLDNLQIDKQIFERLLNKNLFYSLNNKVYSLVPPLFIYNILKTKIQYHILKINQMKKQMFLKYRKGSGEGQFVECLFIQTLIIPNLEIILKRCPYQNHYITFSSFNKKIFSFCPIPKQEQKKTTIQEKFFFLNSFKQIVSQLQSTSSENIQCYLCLPFKKLYRLQTQLPSSGSLVNVKQGQQYLAILQNIKDKVDNTSKLIDFLILRKFDSAEYSIVNLYAFDITTDIKEIKPKIVSFIEEFLNFQDRQLRNQTIGDNKVIFNLKYFVLSGPYSGTVQSLTINLNEKFQNIIQFSNLDANQTIITLKKAINQSISSNETKNLIQQKNSLLLSQVGYFSLEKQKNGVQFVNRDQILNKDIVLFKQIMQIVSQKRKFQQQQERKLKEFSKKQKQKLIINIQK